jgi:hypothetical protein
VDLSFSPSDSNDNEIRGSSPEEDGNIRRRRVPVVHWRDARPPLVLCVAMGRTNGVFEANVAELATKLGLREGFHYWHFN